MAMEAKSNVVRKSTRLQEKRDKLAEEANELMEADTRINKIDPSTPKPDDPSSVIAEAGTAHEAPTEQRDPTLDESISNGSEAEVTPPPDKFLRRVQYAYNKDILTATLLNDITEHRDFKQEDELIYCLDKHSEPVLCLLNDCKIITEVINQVHNAMGHYGAEKTTSYTCRYYWWKTITRDIHEFCKTCQTCQSAKTIPQKPAGKLHSLPIPTKPWDSIGMDFVSPFPESQGFNFLWVILCRMTSMVHLVPITTTMKASELSWIYLKEIVRLHGLPSLIVSNRDA
jgi:hypothetical protein